MNDPTHPAAEGNESGVQCPFPLRVRYHESDQMGVVHHAVYVTWFEAARVEAMRSLGIDYAELERAGQLLAVVDVGLRYRAAVRFGDDVEIESWVAERDRVRVRIEYVVWRREQGGQRTLACTGHTLLAHVDSALKPRRIPASLAQALDRWRRPADGSALPLAQ